MLIDLSALFKLSKTKTGISTYEETSPSTPYRTALARCPDDPRGSLPADGAARSRQICPGLGCLPFRNYDTGIDGNGSVDWRKSAVAEGRAHDRAGLLRGGGRRHVCESGLSD